MIPDWQLPPGVDRGLWDYLNSDDMVRGYDAQMAASPLAQADVAFCDAVFEHPGRLVDLGCGTGRLAIHFAQRGFDCVGVDLSPEMLAQAAINARKADVLVRWKTDNIVELKQFSDASFDYAACLFSTLGMVRDVANRTKVVQHVARILKPGSRFVLHVHNRWFRGLGWQRVATNAVKTVLNQPSAGDVTMPQAYAGAPLTLHHFTRRGAKQLLVEHGFRILCIHAVTANGDSRETVSWGRNVTTNYGYLIAAEKR